MRRLIWLAIVFSCLWAGYWFAVATALEIGLTKYLPKEPRRGDPVQISYSDLSLRGFPDRFETRITDITLTNAKNGIRWSGPFFQISALSYKPYHITAALPDDQTLRLPGEELHITNDQNGANIEFAPRALFDSAAVINHAGLKMRNVAVSSSLGWKAAFDGASVTIDQTDADPLRYDLTANIRAITLPEQMRRLFDPAHLQPAALDSFNLNGTLAFTTPLNLLAPHHDQPALSEIMVKGMAFVWDDVQFLADGSLQIDGNGTPNGTLNLTAHNWQKIYQLADQANAVDPDYAQTIQNGLKVLAGMSKGANVIKAPLILSDGQMFLGPFPIGPAPRLN